MEVINLSSMVDCSIWPATLSVLSKFIYVTEAEDYFVNFLG